MATFVSGATVVTFGVSSDDYQEQRTGRVAVQEIPGGDAFYVDLAGRGPLSWRFTLDLANATLWGLLNTLIAQQGVLSIDTLDVHEAVLMSLSREAPKPDGRMLAQAEFLITDV